MVSDARGGRVWVPGGGISGMRPGEYQATELARIASRPIHPPEDVLEEVRAAEQDFLRVQTLTASGAIGDKAPTVHVSTLARLLQLAEVSASCAVEDVVVSGRDLVRSAFRGMATRDDAAQALGNLVAVERADWLGSGSMWTPGVINDLHSVMFHHIGQPRIAGVWRVEPNWIAGKTISAEDALYFPPLPQAIPSLMYDLCAFMNRSDVAPVVVAAIGHARLEAIHPWADGNGRIGRVVLGAALRKVGGDPRFTLPLSVGIAADRESYFQALHAYNDGDIWPICREVARAVQRSVKATEQLLARTARLRQFWADTSRESSNPGLGAAAEVLLSSVIVDTNGLARTLNRTAQEARELLAELGHLGIASSVHISGIADVWWSRELVTTLTHIGDGFEVPRALTARLGHAGKAMPTTGYYVPVTVQSADRGGTRDGSAFVPLPLAQRRFEFLPETRRTIEVAEWALRLLKVAPPTRSIVDWQSPLLMRIVGHSFADGMDGPTKWLEHADSRAELLAHLGVGSLKPRLRDRAAMVDAVVQAIEMGVNAPALSPATIVQMHDMILANSPDGKHRGGSMGGFRTAQTWVGGGGTDISTAEFVPCPPDKVEPLVADALAFIERGRLGIVATAAIAHLQLVAIHPYVEGTGRTVRALDLAALIRLSGSNVVPVVGPVLRANIEETYVPGLQAYCGGSVDRWVQDYSRSLLLATLHMYELGNRLNDVKGEWVNQVGDLPQDSPVIKAFVALVRYPAATAQTLATSINVPLDVADALLHQFLDMGMVIKPWSGNGKSDIYVAEPIVQAYKAFDQRQVAPGGLQRADAIIEGRVPTLSTVGHGVDM